jgi:transcriptional regulator with XRE-family HTH domain
MSVDLLTKARDRVGLSIAELARRSGTSRSTLSAYEHGRVSPTLETLERVLASTRQRLELAPAPIWLEVDIGRGRVAFVADVLWRLEPSAAVGRVEMPLHLEWSTSNRVVELWDRCQRLRAYEAALREGRPVDIERFVDGALLVDAWDDLVLPMALRAAWQPLIDAARSDG